jgi:MFS family permease
MGGEWASGAALVSDSFPEKHRGKALAFVQSSWAIGYGAAAIANLVILPRWGWRGMFFAGVLPALLTIWIRRSVEEPETWRAAPRAARGQLTAIFGRGVARTTFFVTLMNACTLFGWWGLNGWVPAYLRLSPAQGGVGLSSSTMSIFVAIMQVGMWFGYVSFGFIADAVGRGRAYVTFLLATSVLLPLYGFIREPVWLLLLGPVLAFFGTGYYSGFGALTADIYPPAVRATAQGFTYNIGRLASAAAPYVVGSLAATQGFATAFAVAGVAFLMAALAWLGIASPVRPAGPTRLP